MQIYEAFREKEDLIFNFQEEFPFKLFKSSNIIKQLILANDVLILSGKAKFYTYVFQNRWIFNCSEIPHFFGYPEELFFKQFCDLISIFCQLFWSRTLPMAEKLSGSPEAYRLNMELDL